MDRGDHGDGDLEHWLVSIDPLQVGQRGVRGDLAVGRRGVVGRHTQVEVTQLHLAVLEHGNPLEGGGKEEGERERGREREGEGERGREGEREGGGGREREGEGGRGRRWYTYM